MNKRILTGFITYFSVFFLAGAFFLIPLAAEASLLQVILRPNEPGDVCTVPSQSGCLPCNDHFQCVFEEVLDEDVYISSNIGTWRKDLYGLSSPCQVSCEENIGPNCLHPDGCNVLLYYDTNNDGVISIFEFLHAIDDHLWGEPPLSMEELLYVAEAYEGGSSIEVICPGCSGTAQDPTVKTYPIITSVSVVAIARATGNITQESLIIAIRTGEDSDFESSPIMVTDDYNYYSHTWVTNPQTGAAWTPPVSA